MRKVKVKLPYEVVIELTMEEDCCVGAVIAPESMNQLAECSSGRNLTENLMWNAAWSTLERMAVAAACADIDIGSSEFREAFQTVADAISNEYGES